MSAQAFADGVATLLASEATFQAALTALLGYAVTRVLRSNIPFEQIPSDQWPCWAIEQGDGASSALTNTGDDTDGLTIGLQRQGFVSELEVALLWTQPDRTVAASHRGQLPTLLAQLFMRNPQPGGIGLSYLQSWTPDRGVNHPKHLFNATLRGEYPIYRS